MITLSVYLLVAAERHRDWIERGDADVVNQHWLSVQKYLQHRWPGEYNPLWDQENFKIILVFTNPAAESWFWVQYT